MGCETVNALARTVRDGGIWIGIGLRVAATVEEIDDAIDRTRACVDRGLGGEPLVGIATIDRRANHPALREAAARRGLPIRSYRAQELAVVAVTNSSERVRAAVGTPSVAEAAAILASHGGELIAPKWSYLSVTIAAARKVSHSADTGTDGHEVGTENS